MGQAPKLPEKARAPAGQVFTMAEVEKHDSAASAWFVHSNKVRGTRKRPQCRDIATNVLNTFHMHCHISQQGLRRVFISTLFVACIESACMSRQSGKLQACPFRTQV